VKVSIFNQKIMKLKAVVISIVLSVFYLKSNSQVIINEVMFLPGSNFSTSGGDNTSSILQSMYNTTSSGAEWIELYNSSPCQSIDLSCYIIGGKTTSTNYAAFAFPNGTVLPPLGFLVIGGVNAPNVDINLNAYIGNPRLIGGSRWHLENGCGYVALADNNGNILDAVYWSQNNAADLTAGTTCGNSFNNILQMPSVCAPTFTSLPEAKNIAGIEYIGNYGATAQGPNVIGKSISRSVDASNTWTLSSVGGTPKTCNGACQVNSSFTLSAIKNNPTCGSNNGSVTITPIPAGAYNYTWTAPAISSSNSASGLAAGDYTVTVEQGGCSTTTVITLMSEGGPTITATQINTASCGNSDGSATVTTTSADSYSWSPNGGNQATATNLTAGDYTITVGLAGCYTNSVISIPSSGGPTITATQIIATTCGNNNGSATITATAADSYTWSPNGGNQTSATNLTAGNYTVTVGLAGCLSNTIITVPSQTCCPSSLSYSLSVAGNTVCNGTSNPCNYSGPTILINEIALVPTVNDGSIYGITGLAGGKEGEWIELYNPDWCNSIDISGYILGSYNSTGNNLTTPYASNGMAFVLPQGTIVPPLGFVIVRGSNAPAPPNGVIDVIVNNNGGRLCIDGGITTSRIWFQNAGGWFAFYNKNGVMQDAVKWGTPNASDLNGHPCLPGTNSVTANNLPLSSANQGGTITNSLNNVTPTTGKTFVRIPDGGSWSTIEASINTLGSCNVPGGCASNGNGSSTCSGTAEIVMTSGVAPYTYIWNDPLNQTSAKTYSLCGGNYTVTVKDANQCLEVITVSVSTVITPTINSVTSNSVTCSQNNGNASISAAPINVSYSWIPNVSTTNTATNLSIGNYTVEAILANCSTSTVITIDGTTLDITNSNKITPVSCQNNDGIIEILNITSSNGPHLINFNNNGFSSNAIFNNLSVGIYTLTISDVNNCSISEQINVTSEYAKPNILLPNVFTPNDDKVNDVWYPKVDCIETLSVAIYNRWGEKIAELNNVNEFWDGKSNGKDVTDGNYFFIFEAKSFAGETIKNKGTINLFR
jgi:gliding motility-associated-like protein